MPTLGKLLSAVTSGNLKEGTFYKTVEDVFYQFKKSKNRHILIEFEYTVAGLRAYLRIIIRNDRGTQKSDVYTDKTWVHAPYTTTNMTLFLVMLNSSTDKGKQMLMQGRRRGMLKT